jgi:hypothetical protein
MLGIWSVSMLLIPRPINRILLAVPVTACSLWLFFRLGNVADAIQRRHHQPLKRFRLLGVLEGIISFSFSEGCVFLLLTVFLQFIIALQMYFLISSFVSTITWSAAAAGTTATLFTQSVLPISLGDLGIREMASIYFFSFYQIPAAAVFSSSLLLFFINVILPGIAGILLAHPLKVTTSQHPKPL